MTKEEYLELKKKRKELHSMNKRLKALDNHTKYILDNRVYSLDGTWYNHSYGMLRLRIFCRKHIIRQIHCFNLIIEQAQRIYQMEKQFLGK